ncbi:hypothetical protein B0F90DRAFT_1917729 [Multifurca ochricompacta]|uniref:Phytase-like domain-containing protein n=1 Tax=Multifurca ochricompacta TaxID=376703 RepID=A0AAD4M3Y2_9AGAM|nr:hypothetical protein B0F90DRAFT_1917729 [Multifurca ochricompacta]
MCALSPLVVMNGTVNYQSRQLVLDFTLTPYNGQTPLSFSATQQTLQLTYKETLLYTERGGVAVIGLDALGSIEPPQAIVPLSTTGQLAFTSGTDPATGRSGNQGFEGLTISPDDSTLYALLQSATIQDGGSKKSTARYPRLVAYDISNSIIQRPSLVGKWVVPLPPDSSGKALGASGLHYVSNGIFLVLSRDGNGHGGSATLSACKLVPPFPASGGEIHLYCHRQADLISIARATDIHGTSFDSPRKPIATRGVLDSGIVPAENVGFVN